MFCCKLYFGNTFLILGSVLPLSLDLLLINWLFECCSENLEYNNDFYILKKTVFLEAEQTPEFSIISYFSSSFKKNNKHVNLGDEL